MELSDLLARKNAHVREKEAEALAILKSYGGSAIQQFEAAKRQFGHVLPLSELGAFVSSEANEMFKVGRREATRFLFDAYAETAFRLVSDAEAFITLLGRPICERVRATLDVLDDREAELRKLEWTRLAWKREKPSAIRRACERLRDLWRPKAPHGADRVDRDSRGQALAHATAGDSPNFQSAIGSAPKVEPVPPAQEVPVATGGKGTIDQAGGTALVVTTIVEPEPERVGDAAHGTTAADEGARSGHHFRLQHLAAPMAADRLRSCAPSRHQFHQQRAWPGYCGGVRDMG
jgi:hypothetical protein